MSELSLQRIYELLLLSSIISLINLKVLFVNYVLLTTESEIKIYMFEIFQARSEIKKALEKQTGTVADIIEDKLETLAQEVKDGMPCIKA